MTRKNRSSRKISTAAIRIPIDLYYNRLKDAEKVLKDLKDDSDKSTEHLQRIVDAQSEYDNINANYLYCIRYTDEELASSNAELAVAEASLNQSQERYNRLAEANGVDPTEAARLMAAVAAAQANVDSAQIALDRATLKAPFAGTVISVPVTAGQGVNAGQPVVTLADLASLQAETTDLSERDIKQVRVGPTCARGCGCAGRRIPRQSGKNRSARK